MPSDKILKDRARSCKYDGYHGALASMACNFIKKETLAQVFSGEFCEICKNTFFTEHLRQLLLKPFSYLGSNLEVQQKYGIFIKNMCISR